MLNVGVTTFALKLLGLPEWQRGMYLLSICCLVAVLPAALAQLIWASLPLSLAILAIGYGVWIFWFRQVHAAMKYFASSLSQ